jgi:predicted RNA-binding Zn-ribbon protein involved in translation (DUF1610 family)
VRDRLFDPGPTGRRPITGMALVPLPSDLCPNCGGDLVTSVSWQPALFVACDYGAAKASTIRRCHSCGWWLPPGFESVSPRVFR